MAALGDELLLVRGRRLLRLCPGPGTGPAILSVQPFPSEAAVARDPNRAALLSGFDSVSVSRGQVWAGCGREVCRPRDTRFNVTDFGDGPGTYSHDTAQSDLRHDPAGS